MGILGQTFHIDEKIRTEILAIQPTYGQTAKETKNLQTPNLAKILDIKKMIYQLAGDQKITDEYLIEIIYSKVKSSSTEPFSYSLVFIIYLFI